MCQSRDVQIKGCKELLRTTTLPLDKIAHLAGFEHLEYMNVVFKRTTNETPGSYRKQNGELNGVE
jgi:LacI family transcriptional regulator